MSPMPTSTSMMPGDFSDAKQWSFHGQKRYGQAQGQERSHPVAEGYLSLNGPKSSTVEGQSQMAAGVPGDARPCLGRETARNDLPERNCATKARTGNT